MKFAVGCLLLCLLLAGCATDDASKDVQQQFEQMMNRAIGKATYEEFMTNFGPPDSKHETTSTISGVWEEPSMHGKRVLMTFDRRSQLLKSWSYETR